MNKHDTVIGYIEYLDCNGCVRERIPYVDAEKFKTRIYASLYCGECRFAKKIKLICI